MPQKRPSNPDAKYIMQDSIGPVIAKGLSVCYKEKPHNPVTFFANWLLKQSDIAKRDKIEKLEEKKVQDLKAKNEWNQKKDRKERQRKIEEKGALETKITAFKKHVENS